LPGSNNGDVDQSNDAVTIAGASNGNDTDQSIGQRQAGPTTVNAEVPSLRVKRGVPRASGGVRYA